jgi:nucleotide-binding universal stress UspA family protein
MILLCYEGSTSSNHVIDAAHKILGDAEATLLHVWDPPTSFLIGDTVSAYGLGTIAPEQVGELDRAVRARADRILAEGVAHAREAGFDAEGRLEISQGSPWRTILETAQEIEADLIVVGTHTVGAVEAALLGSVSTSLVHHTHRPVLLVPALSLSES